MPKYTPPVRDTRFILEHVVGPDRYADLPGFQNATADVVDAVLDEGGKFVAEVLFPINHSGDQEGCTRHADGSVTTPAGFKEAYAKFVESGRRSAHLKSSADRGCRMSYRRRSKNIRIRPIWRSPCIRASPTARSHRCW